MSWLKSLGDSIGRSLEQIGQELEEFGQGVAKEVQRAASSVNYIEPFERVVVLANPIATALTEARHALIDPAAPSAATVAGGWPYLLVPVAITAGIVLLGAWAYRRESPRAPELI